MVMNVRNERGKSGRIMGKAKAPLIFGSFVILLRLFAYQLFPDSVSNALFFLGTLMLLFYFLYRRELFLKQSVRFMFWIVPTLYILLNSVLLGKVTWSLALFIFAIGCLVILPSDIDWIAPGFYAAVCVLFIFAFSTVVLFVNPNLYPSIKSAFFLEYHGATGYQSGLTSHYSVNGSLVALGFVLSSCGLMFGSKERKKLTLWSVLTLLFFVALLLTAKRGPLLSAVIAVLFTFVFSDYKGKLHKLIIAGLVLTIGVLILSTFVPQIGMVFDRFTEGLSSGSLEDSTSGRTRIWAKAFSDWLDSPILGIGWGRFLYVYPSGRLAVSLAHNEFLHVLATLGVVGFVLLLVAEAYSLWFTVILVKKSPFNGPLKIGLYGSLATQVLTLVYGYTSGGIVQLEYIVVPYLLAISVVFSIANYIQRLSKGGNLL